MQQADLLAHLRLARTDGIGPANYARLIQRHGSAEAALSRLPAHLQAADPKAIEREIAAVARLGGRFLFPGQPGYPPMLALLPDAPAALACLGDPAHLAARAVAIVGARNASAAGRRIAETLAATLAEAGILVVSGLARGIDSAAHLGALRHGRTAAAVAGGLDQPYPPENAALQDRIAAEGCVLAEAPLGTAPLARHFPRRNRIVAGLALGVVVVEAAPRSGSLITARLALDYGRELYAVPGSPLDLRSQGSNDLIRQGAHLTETVDDILAHLPEAPHPVDLFRAAPAPAPTARDLPPEAPPASDEAAQVLALLGSSPVAVDDLLRRCHLSPSRVQAILLDLELAGRLETSPGPRVALRPPVSPGA
ncbi:DNA-processing protein DprA [Plastoroseomonas hellenica]|uniref:DNA-processing protein DprA n=1 Tax=Plastoroseomonas hellenica TaxID=2687306 RepID=UPI001BA9D1F2|nr:DNA-processing protein DprA [Plastoroseomonas hellenica]MBR0642839.1 DNA-protecting protein DprA [Plastoroseomonas hellenica]